MKGILLFSAAGLLFSALSFRDSEVIAIKSLRFLDEFDVPHKQQLDGTTIGGLSGIDYDAKHDVYYLISDDRSAMNPARFYTASISLAKETIDTVIFKEFHAFRQEGGKTYPSFKEDPLHTPDPEAIRYDAKSDQLVWTSEGERIIKDITILQNPSVNIISTSGDFTGAYPIPSNTEMQKGEFGPRQNGGFEGLSFTPDFKKLFFNVELPLYQDGPAPTLDETKSWIRIYQYDAETKTNTAQFAYRLEKIAHRPISETGFKVNGVADILALDDHHLLSVERSFSLGRMACTIKVFLVDLQDADNIMKVESLTATPPVHPAKKTLLLNMDDLGIYTDNIEGVTFGPTLPNGHRTLIFVADDNFESFELTQFLLFEVN